MIGAVLSAVGMGINAYQRHQEKKRQERADEYNKKLNAQNYNTQRLYNSPSYQMQQMKNAGFNPLPGGEMPSMDAPSAGNPLTANPVESSSLGNLFQSVGQMIQDKDLKLQSLELQKQQIDLNQQKQLQEYEIARAKVNDEILNSAIGMADNGNLEQANDYLHKYIPYLSLSIGEDGKAKILANKKVYAEIEKTQKESQKIVEETESLKQEIIRQKSFNKFCDSRYSNENKLLAEQINTQLLMQSNISVNTAKTKIDAKGSELANNLQELKVMYETFGGVENMPPSDRSKLARVIVSTDKETLMRYVASSASLAKSELAELDANLSILQGQKLNLQSNEVTQSNIDKFLSPLSKTMDIVGKVMQGYGIMKMGTNMAPKSNFIVPATPQSYQSAVREWHIQTGK